MQHLSQLVYIHPGQKCALAIACDALGEQGMISACKGEDLASSENTLPSACITGSLDWNLVHSSSLKRKIPPHFEAG